MSSYFKSLVDFTSRWLRKVVEMKIAEMKLILRCRTTSIFVGFEARLDMKDTIAQSSKINPFVSYSDFILITN